MDYSDVLKYQESLVEKYKYKPIPPLFREEALRFYEEHLPERFCAEGADVPLFSSSGLKICDKYNRIVIGDYGAYVEILEEDIVHENIKIKKGQEYRDFDERYSKHTKYSWLTVKDNSDAKIYFQKKPVEYADYVPGRYYISPYECSFQKGLDKGNIVVDKELIKDWLCGQGVFSDKLFENYVNLSNLYGTELNTAVALNVEPARFEYWIKLCELVGKVEFEQFQAVEYNLTVIDCSIVELKGPFDNLNEDIKTAIQMGLDGIEFPYQVQELSSTDIRTLLKLTGETLLDVSKFCKIVAGCKAESLIKDDYDLSEINRLIKNAEERAKDVGAEKQELEMAY